MSSSVHVYSVALFTHILAKKKLKLSVYYNTALTVYLMYIHELSFATVLISCKMS